MTSSRPTCPRETGWWWENSGYRQAVEEQARQDGGLTGSDDPFVAFYHDVPRALAEEALRKERSESDTACHSPWRLDSLPAVPTKFVVCTADRFFPAPFMRRMAAERLGVVPDEIAGGHCVALSHPHHLGNLLAVTRAHPCRELGSVAAAVHASEPRSKGGA